MKVHFIGVSGIGMSSLAMLSKEMGFEVSGSCDFSNERSEYLKKRNIEIYLEHKCSNIKDPDIVVYTNAVNDDNPEMIETKKKGIKCLPRILFLKELLNKMGRKSIGITGTDGKTTTTAMIAHILINKGFDPVVLLGGVHKILEEGNFRMGNGPVVYELDESDGYFAQTRSEIAVITNVKGDHLENYSNDFSNYKDSMKKYSFNSKYTVIPDEYCHMLEIDGKINSSIKCFKYNDFESDCGISEYMWKNSLCAAETMELLNISKEESFSALSSFENVDRRMSIRYDDGNIRIIDDYAHTPTEIDYLIKSIPKDDDESLILILELHRFTRLRREHKNYIKILRNKNINKLLLLPIYSAYEKEDTDVYEEFICEMNSNFSNFEVVSGAKSIFDIIFSNISCEKNILLFCGAGNSSRISKQLSELISEKILFFNR